MHLRGLITGSFLVAIMGCGKTSSQSGDIKDTVETSARIYLLIDDFVETYGNQAKKFAIHLTMDKKQQEFLCDSRELHISAEKSLLEGWDPKAKLKGGKFREYAVVSCRDADTEILGFISAKENSFLVPSQLLQDDFDMKKFPLILQVRNLSDDSKKYFNCNSKLEKKMIKESDKAKTYEVTSQCKTLEAPDKKLLGPVDFIRNPGPYSAYASYRGWLHPAVASNEKSFKSAAKSLLEILSKGNYKGAMSTLTKTCDLEVDLKDDVFSVQHTMTATAKLNSRKVQFSAENLRGFLAGDLYEDVNGVGEEPNGKFASVEFFDKEKKKPVFLRFEKNEGLEGQIVRIDGATTYCRRLQKK